MNQDVTQVSAKHILVSTQKEAQDLKTKIDNNEISFEDAAKKYSSCPSGQQGGDLGYFPRGVMVKPFEEAAFSADVNKVTEPVQTQFGWHLIKVTDKK
ncbi:peptidylprolyl isomerase [bacterium]|nr:peptidylprolyl isomerase [bacterium]